MRASTLTEDQDKRQTALVGRYLLHRQIARGGMATIHIARLMGDEGFNRIVAAKRLLPEFAEDTEFVSMFMDEARIASKVHHPNVVPVLDLVTTADEVMLVQEYVYGVPLHVLLRTAHDKHQRIPVRVAVSIASDVLAGLHAAHGTVDEMGAPLGIIHRDVSPQNIMIAIDGSARLLDFGVAKATMAAHVTRDNTFKGKLAYSSPEQVRGRATQQSDIYALAVVLWEMLVGHRMHIKANGEAELVATIMNGSIPTIIDALANESDWGAVDSDDWKVIEALEPIVQKGLAVDLAKRYQTAEEMQEDLARAATLASSSEIAMWLKNVGRDFIEGRDKIIAAEEASWRRMHSSTQSGSQRVTPPPDEIRRLQRRFEAHDGRKMMAVVLAGLVALLGIFALKKSGSPGTKPAPVASAPLVTSPAVAPATEAPPRVDPKAYEPPADPPTPLPATREAPSVRRPLRPTPRPAPTAPKIVKQAKPPPTTITATTTAPPPPKEPTPEVAPPPDKTNDKSECNPPYYFEGQKKVFKTNCL